MNGATPKPAIQPIQQLRITRDLSGGARVVFGDKGFLLSPEQAVRVATTLLEAVGIRAEFSGSGKPIIHGPKLDA